MQHAKRTASGFFSTRHIRRAQCTPGTVIFAKQRRFGHRPDPLRGVVVIHDANPVQLLSRAWMHHPRQHTAVILRLVLARIGDIRPVAATAPAKVARPLEATPSAARSSALSRRRGKGQINRTQSSARAVVDRDRGHRRMLEEAEAVFAQRHAVASYAEHRTAWPWTFPGLFQQFQSRCTWASCVNSAKAAEISCVTSRSRCGSQKTPCCDRKRSSTACWVAPAWAM